MTLVPPRPLTDKEWRSLEKHLPPMLPFLHEHLLLDIEFTPDGFMLTQPDAEGEG